MGHKASFYDQVVVMVIVFHLNQQARFDIPYLHQLFLFVYPNQILNPIEFVNQMLSRHNFKLYMLKKLQQQ